MKYMQKLILLLGLAFLSAGAVKAADQDFWLDNETGSPIYHLYISPSASDNWQNDVLGQNVLESGNKTKVLIGSRDDSYRYFDIKIVYENGGAWVDHHVDLIQLNTLVLSWDGTEVVTREITQ